jgi:hypothetical protein
MSNDRAVASHCIEHVLTVTDNLREAPDLRHVF